MHKRTFTFILIILPFFVPAQDLKVPVLDFEGVQPYLENDNDTTYLINFWATWCKPCVEELPLIERIHTEDFDDPVQIILISLDFRSQIESKLIPFLEDKQIRSKVVVLDDPDANRWIDKVDPRWSGALPATIIYRGNKKLFFADGFQNFESIRKEINSL